MHLSAQKLHKIGEYGHGSTILAITASNTFHDGDQSDFVQRLSKTPKIFLYVLDLENGDDTQKIFNSLVNTVNKFHFVKNIIVDYYVFLLLLDHSFKLNIFHDELENIFVINPSKSIKNYRNLLGSNVLIPQSITHSLENNKHTPKEIKSKKINFFAWQEPQTTLSLSASFKNSKLFKCDDYYSMIDKIVELISNEKITN